MVDYKKRIVIGVKEKDLPY